MQRLQQKVWSVTTLFAARCPPKPLCPWHFDPPKPSNQKGGKMGKALTRGTCAVLPLVVLNKLSLEHQREAFTRYHNIVSHVVLHGTPVLSQNCTELVQHPPPYINTLPLCTSCGYEVAFCFRLWNHWKPTLISFLPSSSIMTWIMMFILVILNDHMISKRYASHTHTHFLTHRIPSHFLLGFLPRSKIWCQDLQLPWLQKIRSQNLPCSTQLAQLAQLAQLVQLLKDCLNTFSTC